LRSHTASQAIKTLFAKACWEVSDKPLDWFIQQSVVAGWDATEIYLKNRPESREEILSLHRNSALKLIAQITSTGSTPEEHLASLRENYLHAIAYEPLFVTSHTGRDVFTFDENRQLFEGALELSLREGVPMLHETHRGRALFTGPLCHAYLEALPNLRLTADFSHLLCVHEGNLSDQPETIDAIVAAADHIHARVGFSEGPQLSDPQNPAYSDWVDLSVGFWTRIRERMASAGRDFMTVTPEFGPPIYAPLEAGSGNPVADPWASNHWMRDELRRRWKI
jgi:hypothetical protein